MRIAIVGGGYAGAAVATALLKGLSLGNSITVYEPAEEIGRGVAYVRGPDHHLLNVAAHTIALTPGEEGQFTDWVLENYSDAHVYREDDGAYFFPRAWFGTYVGKCLQAAARRNPRFRLEHRREIARSISLAGDVLSIASDSGTVSYDKVIVAIGNGPSVPLRALEPLGAFSTYTAQSAWDFDPSAVSKMARVVVVGAGLTMADVAASLEAHGHLGSITCISRNGRRSQVAVGFRPDFTPTDGLCTPSTARHLLAAGRGWVQEASVRCGDWRPGVDFIRLNVRSIWRALSADERKRLRRHVRSLWEIHRYQMPPAAHRRLERLAASGRFAHIRASVLGVVPGAVRVHADGKVQDVPADVVVNASGFDTSYRNALAPIDALLAGTGIDLDEARRDGLSVDDHGRPMGTRDDVVGKFYALGFLARANHGDLATVNTIGALAAAIASDICG